MSISFPLQIDKSHWPAQQGICGVCTKPLGDTAVYLCAGTCSDLEKSRLVDYEAFGYCGVHSREENNSRHVSIVEVPSQDQFELSFCSTDCLKEFFLEIVKTIT
jgi:hypothetical protein